MCCVCSEGKKTLISEVTSLEGYANGDMMGVGGPMYTVCPGVSEKARA